MAADETEAEGRPMEKAPPRPFIAGVAAEEPSLKIAAIGAGWAAFGSILGAIGASSCCVLPLALFTLGVSGAWIGDLTALEPYQPIFFGATATFLAGGYYLVYRRAGAACAAGACARPLPSRLTKSLLWAATGLVILAVLFRYFGGLLLRT